MKTLTYTFDFVRFNGR